MQDTSRVAPSQEAPQHVPPSRAFKALRRRKWLILAVVLSLCAPAGFYIAGLQKYFDSEASVLVDTRKSAFSDLQATTSSVAADSVTLRTQSDIIRSPSLAGLVVDRLDLVREFAPILDAKPSLVQQTRSYLQSFLSKQEPPVSMTPAERRQVTIGLLLNRLIVQNDGRSYVITLRVRTADPDLSAKIANAYADAYIGSSLQRKTAAITRGSALLDAQIAPLRDQVRAAETAVENFRKKNGLVLNRTDSQVGQGGTVVNQQLTQVNGQLTVAAGDLGQKEASLRAVQAALRSGSGLYALPEVVSSPLIQRLREQESTFSGREASLSQTALPGNPSVRSAQAALADVRRRIDAEIAKIVSSLSNEVNAARARQDALQGRLAQLQAQVTDQSQANVTLRQLESEAEAGRAVYRDYLARYEQASNQTALQEPEASLVSAAQAPLGPTGPPRVQYAALAAITSLVAGMLLALAVERFRSGGLRTAESLEQETGLFPLGFVPSVPAAHRALMTGRDSIYTEAVNLVRSMLQHGDAFVRARVVLVTSSSPQEGKTFFSVSLAASVGRSGRRALLIDCDLRRPAVAALLQLRGPAPSQAQVGAAASRTELRPNVLPGLDVLTFMPDSDGRLALVSADEMRTLLEELRKHYDMIVLDTPPVLAFADAPALAPAADGVIVVVRWGQTSVASVLSALRVLRLYGVHVLGGVLTQVPTRDLARSDGANAAIYRNYDQYFR